MRRHDALCRRGPDLRPAEGRGAGRDHHAHAPAERARAAPRHPRPAGRRGGRRARGGLAALGATLRSGFDAIAEAVDLDAAIARADLIVTGEGALDATSLDGKVVGGVLARTGKPRAVIAGHVAPGLAIDPEVKIRSLTVLGRNGGARDRRSGKVCS